MNVWLLFSTKSADTLMQHLIEKSEDAYRAIAVKKDKTEMEIELKGYVFKISGEPVRVVLWKKIKK
jgi:hypothetical protein